MLEPKKDLSILKICSFVDLGGGFMNWPYAETGLRPIRELVLAKDKHTKGQGNIHKERNLQGKEYK